MYGYNFINEQVAYDDMIFEKNMMPMAMNATATAAPSAPSAPS